MSVFGLLKEGVLDLKVEAKRGKKIFLFFSFYILFFLSKPF